MIGAVGKYVATAVGIIIVVILGLSAFTAMGYPSTPTVSLQTALTPGSAQVVTVQFTTVGYATNPQLFNGILSSAKIVYSAGYSVVNGAVTMVANNSFVGLNAISEVGGLYTLTATASLSIPQLCTNAQCVGFQENLTVWATATFSPFYAIYSSPQAKITFVSGSTPATGAIGQTMQKANPTTWYWTLFGSVTAGLAVGFSTILAWRPTPRVAGVAALFWIVLAVEYLFWIVGL